MRIISVLVVLILLSGVCVAQSSRKKKKEVVQRQNAPNALDPATHPNQYAPKKSKKKKSDGPSYESEQQYYDRMARLVKEKKKAEKEMLKPQYSNPMYFGHKRPPKKNKRGKLKFCKECGIRH
jgi:hypothetical protein